MLKVLHPHSVQAERYTLEGFSQAMGITYLPHLEFDEQGILTKVKQRCERADKKGWFDPRQKWLGSYYAPEIKRPGFPDITIVWIDETIGYGVIANQTIPRHCFIGMYTGVVRKRRFFGELRNNYCFDYTIILGEKTPYVIDAEKKGNYTRYINHSDRPNLETASALCGGMMHIILYASTDIEAGKELCYDYGENYWAKRKGPTPLR